MNTDERREEITDEPMSYREVHAYLADMERVGEYLDKMPKAVRLWIEEMCEDVEESATDLDDIVALWPDSERLNYERHLAEGYARP